MNVPISELLDNLNTSDKKKAIKMIKEINNPVAIVFIEYYLAVGEETYGHGGRSYAEAYNFEYEKDSKTKNVCWVSASRMLGKAKYSDLVSLLLTKSKATQAIIDKTLLYLVTQKEDKRVALGACSEVNKCLGKHVQKVELDTGKNLTKVLNKVSNAAQSAYSTVKKRRQPGKESDNEETTE